MAFWNRLVRKQAFLITTICLILSAGGAARSRAAQAQAGRQPSTQAPAAAELVGTVKAISGNTVILTTDGGGDVTVQVQDATKLVRIAPGQKDLKEATPVQLADVQPGDRILVRGKLADDGKSVVAASVIAMKKVDIAEKQHRERERWQRHDFGGLVNGVDSADSTISVALPSQNEKKNGPVNLSTEIIFRGFLSRPVSSMAAKPAPPDRRKRASRLGVAGICN